MTTRSPAAGPVERNHRGKGLVGSYWTILGDLHRSAKVAIALTVLSGLLETVGILAVVPIVEPNETVSAFGVTLQGSSLRYAGVLSFVVFALLASVVRVLAERALTRLVAAFERRRRGELTRAALGMDWAAFLKIRAGDVNTSLLLSVHQVSSGVQFFVRAMGMLGVAIIFVAVAVSLSVQLSIFTAAFVVLAAVTYFLGAKPTRRHTTSLTAAASSLGQEADLLFGSLKLFRSQGERVQSQRRMETIYADYANAYVKSMYIVPRTRSMFEIGGIVGIGAVLLGALATAHGAELSAASLAFLVLFLRLAPRLISTQEHLQNARSYRSWCDTWWETLDAMHASPMATGGTRTPSFERGLRVEQVGYTYPGRTEPVLEQVSWELRPGQAIALVGESGAGKTTMLDLVTGLLQPTRGRITVDGVDLAEVDTEQWQSHLGLVPQESPLFAATVLENVYWTEARREPDEARRALELAQATTFVDRLPDGMATVLGQRATTLSGGQRQRLALARALYRRPWVLVLDEPTSSLDASAEDEVLRALEAIKSTCAMIVVSHNLNPVRLADQIYVMAGGTITEHGTWEELVVRPEGRFARIVRQRSIHG